MAKIAILNIGNEVLDGRTVNTNATFFAEAIHRNGFNVTEIRVVPDEFPAIARALKDLLSYDFVIATGGLGPTDDDLTAKAVAKAFHQPTVLAKAGVAAIRAQLKTLNLPYTEIQERQAILPKKARVLKNTWGIAPGFEVKQGKTRFFFMPGVPRECRPMFEHFVLPVIKKTKTKQKLLRTELWRCFGRREADLFSDIADLVEPFTKKFGLNFDFSSQIPFPVCDIRVEFWQNRDPKNLAIPSKREMDDFTAAISERLGSFVYARDRRSLVQVVIEALRAQGATLAVSESCTGGMLGQMITDISGCSDVFLGGAINYANSAKEILAGVPNAILRQHGAVSAETAEALSSGIRERLRADFALSLTGVSGPGGGTAAKPVGTIFVGLSSPYSTKTVHLLIKNGRGDRLQNRSYASHLALDMLRQTLIENSKGKKNGNERRRTVKQG